MDAGKLAAVAAVASALVCLVLRRRTPPPLPPPPETMRAVVAREGACSVASHWPTPSPGDLEVMIAVKATAVNRLDCMQRAGKAPVPTGVTEVLGLEASGVVVRCGARVRNFRVGDEVMALAPGGAYAEYLVVDARTVMLKPASLSWAEAASIPEAWLTAYKLVHTVGKVQAGETVLVHAAASGVGMAAVQLVVAAGATALVTVGSAEKLAFCQRLGAAGGAIRHDGPWGETIAALAPGGKVDVVLDCVAGGYASQTLSVLATDGRWVLYSMLSGAALAPEELGKTFLAQLMKKRLSLLATTLRTRPLPYKQRLVEQFVAGALPRLAARRMEHVIDREFRGLEEAQAAHEYMQADANAGKIVITLE
ncbi:hypothetical protein AB1Y20_013271 [Prymnesium parvum]|uniref:Enoyl reductase (ER) domain-containing protein n=1 Tax=Prymnesium parvum TaxID=97485 RepID=A0AB34IK65_PRYPA